MTKVETVSAELDLDRRFSAYPAPYTGPFYEFRYTIENYVAVCLTHADAALRDGHTPVITKIELIEPSADNGFHYGRVRISATGLEKDTKKILEMWDPYDRVRIKEKPDD